MDIYKTESDELFSSDHKKVIEQITEESYLFLSENICDQTTDISSLLETFLNIFESGEFESEIFLNNLNEIGKKIQSNIDESSIQMFVENNIAEKLFSLIVNPPSMEIYDLIIWIIGLLLSSLAVKYKHDIIFEVFSQFDLLNFLIAKLDPEFQERESPQMMIIPQDDESIHMLSYYLTIFSSYCRLSDQQTRDYLIKTVLIPNFEYFFDDLSNGDIVEQASLFIMNSTFYPISFEEEAEYIKSIFILFIRHFGEFNSIVQIQFLKTFYNLIRNEQNVECFWAFHFDSFLVGCIHKQVEQHKLVNDVLANIFFILQILLNLDHSRIKLNYCDLLKYISSDNEEKYINRGYQLFIQGLELQKPNLLSDGGLYQRMIELLQTGSFHLKCKIAHIIEKSIETLSNREILEKSCDIMDAITPLLLNDSWNDNFKSLISLVINLLTKSQHLDLKIHSQLLHILLDDAIPFLYEMINENRIPKEYIPQVESLLDFCSKIENE